MTNFYPKWRHKIKHTLYDKVTRSRPDYIYFVKFLTLEEIIFLIYI